MKSIQNPFKARMEVLEALHANAKKHADASNGFFVIDPLDDYPLDEYGLRSSGDTSNRRHVSANRLDPVELESVAGLLDKRYKNLHLSEQEARDSELSLDNAAEIARFCGLNISLLLRHSETRDIAFGLGKYSMELAKREIVHRTALVLSKGIQFLRINTEVFGYNKETTDAFLLGYGIQTRETDGTVPITPVLGLVADATYFVIPNSPSFTPIRERHPLLIDRFNASTLRLKTKDEALTGKMYRGTIMPPVVTAIAATGQTELELDKPAFLRASADGLDVFETIPTTLDLDEHTTAKIVGRIGLGILHHTKNQLVATGGFVLSNDRSHYYFNPRIIFADEDKDIPRIETGLYESLCALEPDTLFIIDRKNNLPTTAPDPKAVE